MKYKFLIVDDNVDFTQNLSKELQQNLSNFIKEINICNDGESGIKELIENPPDVLLLDLKLPKLDGLTILEKSKNINCSIVIISGEIPLINHIRILDNNNVKKILVKPFSLNIFVKELDYICSEKYDNNLRKKIEKELNFFNFNEGSIGYRYLVECLLLSCKQPYLLSNVEKDLFSQVAKTFGVKNAQTVKWSMQKTIKAMIKYTNIQKIQQYFLFNQFPSLKLFITTIHKIIMN